MGLALHGTVFPEAYSWFFYTFFSYVYNDVINIFNVPTFHRFKHLILLHKILLKVKLGTRLLRMHRHINSIM